MAMLTDEEYNALFDAVASNENLTPEQMDALSQMREDMYDRMSYMKDNETYREKYEDLEKRYRTRWNEERKFVPVTRDEEGNEDVTEVSYDSIFGEEEK